VDVDLDFGEGEADLNFGEGEARFGATEVSSDLSTVCTRAREGQVDTMPDRAPQRWARVACWTAFGCAVPSAAWRLAMLAGVDVGFANVDWFRGNTGGTVYVLALETVQLTAATLCLGLCQRWGERVPHWVPRLGGRAIPARVPLVVGGVGNGMLYLIIGTTTAILGSRWLGITEGWTPTMGMDRGHTVLLAAAYAPMLIWPVALTVGLVGYRKRRYDN